MGNRGIGVAAVGAFGVGALVMYFADPDRGRRRRVVVKDAVTHSVHEVLRFSQRFRRDFENRLEGALAESLRVFDNRSVSDSVLVQRVRTALGRIVSHPGAIEVTSTDGSVFLSGWVLADEVDDLTSMARSIRGVRELSTFLSTTDRPEHISALQSARRRRMRSEFVRDNWSPSLRVLAGSAGAALILYGLIHRGSIGKFAGINGAILLARSILNSPLRRITGSDPAIGIHIQKTITIDARADDLYRFWTSPENYPRVFSHVKKITREGENLYRWVVAGPGGAPITWIGRIARQVPNRLVEWQSTPESMLQNHGIAVFESEKDGPARIHVRMSYCPPAGLLGHSLAMLLGLDPKSAMDNDFVRLKSLFEHGKTRSHGQNVQRSELKCSSAMVDQVA
jgi:uncharacterized membrane protein